MEEQSSSSSSPTGTRYYSFQQGESDDSDSSSKASKDTLQGACRTGDDGPPLKRTQEDDTEPRKVSKVSEDDQKKGERSSSSASGFSPDPPEWDKHKKAWGYLQNLSPDKKGSYLERQSYDPSSRTGYLLGRRNDCDLTYGQHSRGRFCWLGILTIMIGSTCHK